MGDYYMEMKKNFLVFIFPSALSFFIFYLYLCIDKKMKIWNRNTRYLTSDLTAPTM